jgi:hypothetical protein
MYLLKWTDRNGNDWSHKFKKSIYAYKRFYEVIGMGSKIAELYNSYKPMLSPHEIDYIEKWYSKEESYLTEVYKDNKVMQDLRYTL